MIQAVKQEKIRERKHTRKLKKIRLSEVQIISVPYRENFLEGEMSSEESDMVLTERIQEIKEDEAPERGIKDAEENDPFVEKDEVQEEKEVKEEIDDDGWLDVLGSGRLKKRTVEEGDTSAAKPRNGQTVKFHKKVAFQDRLALEDRDAEIVLSEGEDLRCLDLVLPLMYPGEVAEVIADPDFAYGSVGLEESGIPANAAVTVTVELVAVQDSESVEEMSLERRMSMGRRKKDRGNFWYSRGEFTQAIQNYRKATDFFDDPDLDLNVPVDRFELPEEKQELLGERIKAFNNLAQGQMKIEAWDAALAALGNVLKVEPNNEKALYRKSKVYEEKGRSDECLGLLRRITRLYPENKSARADLARMTAKQRKNKEQEFRMSKRMLGLDKVPPKRPWYKSLPGSGLYLAVAAVGALAGAVAAVYKFRDMGDLPTSAAA